MRTFLKAPVAALAALFVLATPHVTRADTRILLIGDSHTYLSFGRKLDSLLRTIRQAQVETIASCGSSPFWWFNAQPTNCGFFEHDADGSSRDSLQAPTPLLQDVLNRFKPTLTLVALGANMMNPDNAPLDFVSQTTRQMAQMIAQAGSQCVWVGPPTSRIHLEPHVSEVDGILRGATTPECHFIDSRPFTHYPDQGGDGLHYDSLGPQGVAMAQDWAQKIFDAFTSLMNLTN
jgi:hypothetical protein